MMFTDSIESLLTALACLLLIAAVVVVLGVWIYTQIGKDVDDYRDTWGSDRL